MFDEAELAEIRASRDRWESDTRDPAVERAGTRADRFATVSNHEVRDLYTPADVADLSYVGDLGFPGEAPYTRGVYPTMYRGRTWTMRQFAGFGTAAETNERFHYLVDQGQTGLSTAFDMPSLMGLDSDDPMAAGEVGREGVAVDTIHDVERLFEGIDISEVTTSFTINPSAPVVFAMYVALADRRGVPRAELGGTLQNDMLKEFIAQKEWVVPPEPSMKLVTDVVEFAARETPSFRPVSISGYHIREAGSTAVQELAFTLANGFAYVEDALDRGLEIDAFAPQLSFFFNSHNSVFEEVAKFRAARRLYARLMAEWYDASDERSRQLKFHTQTAGQSLTAQQPLVNVVRVTLQAFAAVLGGTQSLHTNSYDEALALPSEEAVRIALRTQQVIAEESGAADTIDPLGGSFFVESLTDELETEAMAYLEAIRERGDGSMRAGVLRGIETGYFQREIQDAAYEYQTRVETGEEVVVGVNRYAHDDGSEEASLHHVDDEVEARQRERLAAVRRDRDDDAVDRAVDRVREAVRADENVLPALIEAVKREATMGELMDVFRAEYGEYREPAGRA
jgi:methylmalonyl-CoA mutase N-terminal domain/subunit